MKIISYFVEECASDGRQQVGVDIGNVVSRETSVFVDLPEEPPLTLLG